MCTCRGHKLCWHPSPSGTHPASSHGINIVLFERTGHDHGDTTQATPVHCCQSNEVTPASAIVRKYRARGTCGTFAGRRPPTSTCPVALAAYSRAHEEHLKKQQQKLIAMPRQRKLQATPGQESYRHFSTAMLKLEAGGTGAQRLRSVAEEWKKHRLADQSLRENR